MTFEAWWQDVGQRVQAFDARSWAKAGWNGARLHVTRGLEGPEMQGNQPLLEDSAVITPDSSPDAVAGPPAALLLPS